MERQIGRLQEDVRAKADALHAVVGVFGTSLCEAVVSTIHQLCCLWSPL